MNEHVLLHALSSASWCYGAVHDDFGSAMMTKAYFAAQVQDGLQRWSSERMRGDSGIE